MRVRLTPQAEADIGAIAAYLEARSPRGARRVEAAIGEALALIGRYPEIGNERQQRVRRFALPRHPYLVFYRTDEPSDTVQVLAVRHAARRPEDPDAIA